MTATLDIATVQAFLLVADLQSFTRTAEALGTTQAAVSLKLQRLETLLGKRLVERSPRAVGLTADGALFLDRARALMEAHDRALSGEAAPETTHLIRAEDHAALNLEFRPETRVARIDPAAKQVVLADGERIAYDKLILATGGTARRLPIPGGDLPVAQLLHDPVRAHGEP